MEHWLASRDDIAALILEPTGATFGQIPTSGETLRRLRELTTRYGVLLIFDEVISGFRCSPGGAQQFYGVIARPDDARQDPGGRVSGRRIGRPCRCAARAGLPPADDTLQSPLVAHQGTYNAGPVSAAAGIATLEEISRRRRHRPRGTHRPQRFATESTRQSAAGAWSGAPTASSRISTSIAAAETPEEIYAGKAPLAGPEGRYPAGTGEQDPGRLSAARCRHRLLARRTCLGRAHRGRRCAHRRGVRIAHSTCSRLKEHCDRRGGAAAHAHALRSSPVRLSSPRSSPTWTGFASPWPLPPCNATWGYPQIQFAWVFTGLLYRIRRLRDTHGMAGRPLGAAPDADPHCRLLVSVHDLHRVWLAAWLCC